MNIKSVDAKSILDSRKEKTIQIFIKTSAGVFSASAPNGKSKGKYEARSFKKSLEEDINAIKKLSDYFSKENIEGFSDLRRIEDIVEGHVGANTLFALESAVLKALAEEQKKQVWQLINSDARKFPRLVGNCIGGGQHSKSEPKPDFQEFLLIPNLKSVKQAFEKNKKQKNEAEKILKNINNHFKSEKNDEDAWMVSLNEKQILDVLKKTNLPLGIDVAASSFYRKEKYSYKNPELRRTKEEHFNYISSLIKNFNIFYIEDPFQEEDFDSFSKLLKKFSDRLIVGDDLIVTNYNRLEKALEKKSINAIIVKPNQCGSLLEVERVCKLANKNNIKIVFSHRSGETDETILADLAFGFQADFLKCGITGKEREAKIQRLIKIQESF